MVRQKKLVGQMPMEFMLPPTDWVVPSELPDLRRYGDRAVDLETKDNGLANGRGPGWPTRDGFVTGVTIAVEGRSVYAPVRHPDTNNFDSDAVRRWLQDHLDAPGYTHYHNAPYDLGWCWAEWDMAPPERLHDTLAMCFIYDENRLAYNLDSLCKWQGIPGKDETMLRAAAEAFGYNPKSEMWKLPARYVAPYAEQDGTSTLQLGQHMLAKLPEQELVDAYELERDIIPLCLEMRKRGVRLNTDKALQVQQRFYDKSSDALRQLSEKAAIGRQWTIDDVRSPRFMADIFRKAQVPFPQTAKGNDSFANEWMSKFDHWLPQLCARALKTHDAADKFIGEYLLGYAHMGRIHAEIHQFKDDRGGTRTTRFSYSDPPLQQMPSRDEEIARDIRDCFDPEDGELWGAIDYSQQEYRLMVHFAYVCNIAGSEKPHRMYNDDPDTDFHDMVVEMTGLVRRRAKDVNFAKAFGAGVPKFALMTGMSLDEAKSVMQQYDEEMPWLSRLNEFCQKRVDQRGFIRMIDGARGRFERWEPRWTDYEKVKMALDKARMEGRPLPELTACSHEEALRRTRDPDHPWTGRIRRAFTHKSLNTLIQGSAARQMKLAMRECWRAGIVPLLQMHDELDISTGDERTAQRVAELMRDVVKLSVPVKTDVEFGRTWGWAAKHEPSGYKATWAEALASRGAAPTV